MFVGGGLHIIAKRAAIGMRIEPPSGNREIRSITRGELLDGLQRMDGKPNGPPSRWAGQGLTASRKCDLRRVFKPPPGGNGKAPERSTMSDINTLGLRINKPATENDGYDGGLQIVRDTAFASGGTHGHVNCASYTRTVAGKDLKQFEWNALMILDNHAQAGENCAMYAQANRHSSGHTFAGVFEACDTNEGGAESSLRGLEVDVWCSGPDTGNRVGVDICAGDARKFRSMEPSKVSVGTVALRVSSDTGDPRTVGSKWSTAIQLTGPMDVGLDTHQAKTRVALRIGWLQSICIGGVPIPGLLLVASCGVSIAQCVVWVVGLL